MYSVLVTVAPRPDCGDSFTLQEDLPLALHPLVDRDGEINLGVLRLAAQSLLFENDLRMEDLGGFTFELRATYPDLCKA